MLYLQLSKEGARVAGERRPSALLPQSAGRCISVRKYVDNMVLVSTGYNFAGNLCDGYRQVHESLTAASVK
eukprot:3962963-Amphidinium_carterae.1